MPGRVTKLFLQLELLEHFARTSVDRSRSNSRLYSADRGELSLADSFKQLTLTPTDPPEADHAGHVTDVTIKYSTMIEDDQHISEQMAMSWLSMRERGAVSRSRYRFESSAIGSEFSHLVFHLGRQPGLAPAWARFATHPFKSG